MDPKLSHCIANFAVKFANELGTDKTSICSPLSAEIVLALLALGCKNQSHAELLKALDMTDDEALRSSFAYLASTLASLEKDTLKMANKIYVRTGKNIKPAILKDAEQVFVSSLEQLDFEEKEVAADIINKWVTQQTDNKIKGIVSPEMLNSRTSLVLVNAIYFQGQWEIPFRKAKNRPFHVNNTTEILVPQMFRDCGVFHYGVCPELKGKILDMRYKGIEASMVFILPDEIEGLNSVLDRLRSGYDLIADIADLKKHVVPVQIPKFKAETTINLKELLPKMGVKSIFEEENSDIDILTSNEKLFVSEAMQKAFIEIDEKGTRVAACTALVPMSQSAKVDRRPRFIADHPFLYLLIVHKIPLFIGVYQGSEYAQTPASTVESVQTDSVKL